MTTPRQRMTRAYAGEHGERPEGNDRRRFQLSARVILDACHLRPACPICPESVR